MNWLSLLAVLVELFRAVLPFLEELFDKTPLVGPVSVDDAEAVRIAFAEARRQLWPWQLGRRALLNRAEAVAARRLGEVCQAARYGDPAPKLGVEEGLYVTRG